ncbi:Acid phosphatase [Phytophthora citrophthora]|uniref:Purple acid phosphatase n=1 Tax=Phytophthora citrophthora TaxID=4793 RepID=A0AAD9GXU0_9STRA|nr:Acid phosphatase [Phytophthora citrophthora]
MRTRLAFHLTVVVSLLCSVATAKQAGLSHLFASFFNSDDATGATSGSSSSSHSTDDRTCVYKWSTLSCQPKSKCSIQYRFGDMTPSQACRIRDDGDHTKVPQQFHLAFAGEEAGTGMAISWTTFALEESPAVWIGTSESKLTRVKHAKITKKKYYEDSKYELINYHAVVNGLEPNTEYFYKVGSATEKKFQSAVSSFKTARESGDESPFIVAVYGDMGTDANSVAANKFVNSLVGKVDFIYHLGDISYADNDFLNAKTVFGFFYEEVWNKFMNSMTSVMRHMAYMVVVGNHEAECHSPNCLLSEAKKDQLGNYTAFNARFRMPSPESGGVLNMWYSFDYASVHFTTLSSETDFPHAPSNAYYTKRTYGNFGNQLAWLEADLKAAHANRANVPWIVVGMHRPMYTLRSCDDDGVPNDNYESLKVQKAFEKLFIKYKVDLVYEGHVHSYERHYPTANSTTYMAGVSKDGKTYTNPKAPVHVIAGSAGSSEGLTVYKNPPSPKWLAISDNEHYGITTLSVTPTNLTITMVETATGEILDEFSIIKESADQEQLEQQTTER